MASFLQQLIDHVPTYLSRYRSHPLFDDMVQEGRIAAAFAAERFADLPEEERRTYCLMRAYSAGLAFLASPRNLYRTHSGGRRPEVKAREVPLSQLNEEGERQEIWRRTEPDIAPAVISEIWTRKMLDRLCRTEREREIMLRHVYHGDSLQEIAAAVGGFKQGVRRTQQRMARRFLATSGNGRAALGEE